MQFKTKPFRHQLEVFHASKDKDAFAYLMEMGTGKSKVMIDKSAYLYGNGRINGLLVIAPNGVHRNWIHNEIPAHLPDHVERRSAYYASSMKRDETTAYESLFDQGQFLRVLTINIEAMNSEKGRKAAERFLRTFQTHLVVDESSKIKHHDTARTKHVLKLSKLAKYRSIATGTPVTQSPLDIFSQFMFLDPHILPTQSFYVFKARYAELLDENSHILRHIMQRTGARRAPQVIATDKQGKPIYKNLDELQRIIAPHSYRVLKKDCLDLPDKVYERRYFDLEPEQKKVYKQIKDDLRIEFDGGQFTAMSKLTAVMRLQQVASGIVPLPEGGEALIFEDPAKNPRIKALMDILEEVAGKAIIWCRFKSDIAQIKTVLEKAGYGEATVYYHGDVSDADRVEAINKLQHDDKIRFFVGTQAAGGTGLTLTAANTVVYYSNTFNLEDRLQSEDRAHRIGQKNNVTYFDLEAVDTIDRRIVSALRMKKDVADLITGDNIGDWIK